MIMSFMLVFRSYFLLISLSRASLIQTLSSVYLKRTQRHRGYSNLNHHGVVHYRASMRSGWQIALDALFS